MAKTESRNIGMVLESPKQKCTDINCPFHGKLSVRGRRFTGTVISTKMRKTAVIEFERMNFLKKYERYEKRRTRLKVHNPECINAKDGDIVDVIECRPLSKTKNFVIIKNLGQEKGFKGKMEAREASKVIKPVKEEPKPEEEK
ncbi:MAG TPA: 30S ribosomal protein S17 [Candidatus Nanoarchaeia archaeon]|nr:30S ribosomal protein S17 [Candidatus Nanoarchaeia archaeon]